MRLTDEYIQSARKALPELPEAKAERYKELGLNEYDAQVIVADKDVAVFFEEHVIHRIHRNRYL